MRSRPESALPDTRRCAAIWVTLRVLRPDGRAENPDGDVRQDIGLLVARDTAAQSAQVSRVHDSPRMWCPVRTPIYRTGWMRTESGW